MTEPMLDVLTYTKDLEDAGFNRTQAEAIARGNFTVWEQRFDKLVTREHFDTKLDSVDERLTRLEKRLDALDPIKTQVTLLTWMMGIVILVLVVPQLQTWFALS